MAKKAVVKKEDRAVVSFRGAYEFLGNGYRCPIVLDAGVGWSVEHAYQALKTLDRKERAWILAAEKAFGDDGAKKRGRAATLRSGWEDVKDDVMLFCLRQKFSQAGMAAALLRTGYMHLEEGNYWGDRYWGTVDGVGENRLGELLMQVRQDLIVVYGS